jgi:hypothetical protein
MRSQSIIDAVEGVTSKWAKQRKAEERAASARARRRDVMTRQRQHSLADIVYHVLPEAWANASGDGKYPTLVRQIYYAVRPLLQAYTGRSLGYGYFSQTLLPDYLAMRRLDWDVMYDARGNFREPHTQTTVPLGTLQVRNYLNKVSRHLAPTSVPSIELNANFPTVGPQNRYGAILFLEKEGFQPLLEAARIAERYDLAIMSTKGMSVTASRQLVEKLCAPFGVPLLILHDFDVSGFTIAGTLQSSTCRFQFSQNFRVVDFGLRLADVESMELESEDVYFGERVDFDAKIATLQRHGATAAEIHFLVGNEQRVELNAMTSPQFIDFLEAKLAENGISKMVPDPATLAIAAQRAAAIARMQQEIDTISATVADIDVPADLETQVRARLAERSDLTWDQALVGIMGGTIAPLAGEEEDDDDDLEDDDDEGDD